jgi:hypothetical protein
MVELLSLSETVTAFLVALGLTYVITGAEVGFPLRFAWCWLFQWHCITRILWALVRCPPCNAWWSGLLVGFLVGGFVPALQMAFVSCGLVAVLQFVLGGDGIASNEDFFEVFVEPRREKKNG